MNCNIVVAVRIRPLIARENEQIFWVKEDKYICRANNKSSTSKVFCFDRVFDTEQSTAEIYNDVCLPIVNSTIQGFNGTIFAYGQTASGKTYTMMGEYDKQNKDFVKHRGIIHYCIEDIFSYIQEMPDREFLLRVSFLEIYNEKVFDLLSSKNEDLKLLEDRYGNIKVSGLEEKIVQTADQIRKWMGIGQNKRHTGETQMNRASSRSHSIFRMIIESRLKNQEVVNVSQLNLVDLAGSENLKETNKGERFQEGVHINLSLSTLCQVIRQLSERDQFINYRNSKLTRLLQTSLGGNARTAIICAVNPASVKETLSTLEFAQRAKKIQNKPMKNEIVTDQALLKQYANKIKTLAMELEASKEQGKELEEKTKQNKILKRQIEALKANFVSQTVKSIRRETWGGLPDTRRFQQLEGFSFKPPRCTDFDLPTLEDFEIELDATSFSTDIVFQQRDSLKPKILNEKVSDAETQTELENEECNDDEKPKTLVPESNPCLTCTTLQTELDEIKKYTTLEFQYLKAGNEQEIENLKQENITLKKRLTSLLKFEANTKMDAQSEWEAKLLVMSKELEVKYENKLAEIRHKLAETESNKCDLRSFEERNKKLEDCNRNLEQKLTQLEASYTEQVKELELKHVKELAELKCVLSESESNRLNNLKLLEEKNSELEECNRDFKQKITDLESSHVAKIKVLEENFETERSEWIAKIRALVKDMVTKHEQELTDLENGVTKDIMEICHKRIEVCVKEASEMKEELVKLQNLELINIKEQHLKQIKELEDLVSTVSLDKGNEIIRLNRELFDVRIKYEKMIIEYRSKVRKCGECYRELQIQAQLYMEENERIKNQISSDTQLKEEVKSLINEKDVLLKKHAAAELEIKNLKESLENLKRLEKHISNSKELEDHNKMLRLDLDQKKAKIICLETNNANLVHEINKLKGKAALKDGSCKCKMNMKGLKVETPLNNENAKENSDKKMLEEKTYAEFQRIHKPVQSEDFKKENDSQDKGKVEENDPYLLRGDSATFIRCQFLEGIIYQKDKEIKMLKKKCADLNSELARIKNCPIISSKNKPEVRKSDVVKSEVKRTPVSALYEKNEEVTAPVYTPPQNQGGIRNVYRRQNLVKHRRESYTPYLRPLNDRNSENHPQEIPGQLNEETMEIKQSTQGDFVMDVLYGKPECKQQ